MATKTVPANRRRAERREVSKGIALLVDSGRNQIASQAFAVDLSQLGARVRTSIHLELGQEVTVIPREGQEFAVPSRVIWVHYAPSEGDAEAGLAFLQPQAPSSPICTEMLEP